MKVFGLMDGEGLRVLNPSDEALTDEALAARIRELHDLEQKAQNERDVRRAIAVLAAGGEDISGEDTYRGWSYRVAHQRMEQS